MSSIEANAPPSLAKSDEHRSSDNSTVNASEYAVATPEVAKPAQDPVEPQARLKVEDKRLVYFNAGLENQQRCRSVRAQLDNFIVTSKYSLLTFVPRNLFEQFLRVANFYFLILLILQLIPAISSLNPITTALPLAFVLIVTLAKDGSDDLKRHKSDKEVNNRETSVLRDGAFVKVTWSDVKVGDIVRLVSNDPIPADIVLLSSSSVEGDCFVETADLDGETNLKLRQARLETNKFNTAAELQKLRGIVNADAPNNNLHAFNGSIKLVGATPLSINNDNGCVLRNTEHAYGIAVYCGADTKVMLNGGAARFKRTRIDVQMNKLVWAIFGILISMCIIAAALNAHWEATTGQEFTIYLKRVTYTDPTVIGTLQFFSYIIILNTLVPISLYVSVEIIRLGQSFLINWDLGMYHEESDSPAVARTTTLNEELGQIDYIFSDKTGTLTCNEMNFVKCSIDGVIYGESLVEGVKYTGFKEATLSRMVTDDDPRVCNFFRLLALCHTIQPEEIDGKIEYQAQSPDEKALTEAARDMDVVFEARTQERVSIHIRGTNELYELLNIIEFNSTRKRMSVILRTPDGVIRLYSKGADNIMRDRLSKESLARDWPKCSDHLHVFAKDGLRTLVLAQRDISQTEYDAWSAAYNEAELAPENRDDLMGEVAERIERELTLLGVTAIDDKLQVGVPDAIYNLKRAGIKVWVLTGDKQETAINIGTSCRLLGPEMEPLIVVNGGNFEEVRKQVTQHAESIRAEAANPNHRPFGLVIDGPSLVYALMPEKKEIEKATEAMSNGTLVKKWSPERLAVQQEVENAFVDMACQCSAVVCCRVSPLQKAQIVNLIKKHKDAVTLAIGDGANDVSMIKAAHVGIGISGHEGRQAVLASDYSIAQFRFLQRLLLVHGRWSYLRMGLFLRYFFYKNFAFTVTQFWFGIYNGWSAQTLYDATFIAIYNVIFTSLPVLAVGIFEQDVSEYISIKIPQLYEAGPRNKFFSNTQFFVSLFRGTYHAVVLFFVFYLGSGADGVGQGDIAYMSTVLSFVLVYIANLQLALEVQHFSRPVVITLLIGPVLWLLIFWIYYTYPFGSLTSTSLGAYVFMFNSAFFWFVMMLSIGFAILPMFLINFLAAYFRPIPNQIALEIQKYKLPLPSDPPPRVFEQPAGYSSYDFSQQDGAGRKLFPANPYEGLLPRRSVTLIREVAL